MAVRGSDQVNSDINQRREPYILIGHVNLRRRPGDRVPWGSDMWVSKYPLQARSYGVPAQRIK